MFQKHIENVLIISIFYLIYIMVTVMVPVVWQRVRTRDGSWWLHQTDSLRYFI